MRNRILTLIVSCLLLNACGTAAVVQYRQDNPDADFYEAIIGVAKPDVKAALKLAQDKSDAKGAACWSALDVWLATLPDTRESAKLENTGVALAIERARIAFGNDGDSMIPDQISIGCAAMVNDMKRKGIKFAAIMAATKGAGAGGLAGSLPGLFAK